jgi:sugar phosphate isomerase/epimerase|tara:strand:- start:11405 stop:12343 length:939 start_codon:yes stop_codon:yes gene_type:complete
MKNNISRRQFIKQSGILGGALSFVSFPVLNSFAMAPKFDFEISLAQWSLHNALFKKEMTNLDFAPMARKEFGISGVEYVNSFFKDKAKDNSYLKKMNELADDNGVKNVLIMIDGEGHLGASDNSERMTAVENHYKWVEAAKTLGCHSIRVNAAGKGSSEEVQKAAIDGLTKLSTFAKDFDINIIVENHGGFSSNGKWLNKAISSVGMDNCGTLPDFGNFCIKNGKSGCEEEYDRYQGMKELMPFAKGVSAKSHDFDAEGNETKTDFRKMLNIVKKAKFSGFVGIEYEGSALSEIEGIKATKKLLEKIREEYS